MGTMQSHEWDWLTAWDEPESTEAKGIALPQLSESFPAVETFDFDALMERDRAQLDALLREVQSGDAAVNAMLDDMAARCYTTDNNGIGLHYRRAIARLTHHTHKHTSTRK